MLQDKQKQILQAIKQDDLVVFSSLLKGNKTLSFGRFPLLTLCYLYKAKKIIKNFESDLLKIQNYIVVLEPLYIYKDFKNIAGKCMRLYLQDDVIVHPLEMLAILHKDTKVKNVFNSSKTFDANFEKIKKIYTIYGQNVDIVDGKIKISKVALSYKQKKSYKLAIILATSCIIFASICFGFLGFTTGFGTIASPFVLCSQTQLSKALNTSANYILSSDITIDEFFKDSTFSGTLDGKNKTIYIKDTSLNYLVLQNNGTIKNLNIVYFKTNKQISSSFSLLTNINRGTIQNVNITCEDISLNVSKNKTNEIYINGFANTNYGTIKNCSIKTSMKVESNGEGECCVSGIAGINRGKVESCNLKTDSSVTTSEADLSGIVTTNELNATVTNCKNYATLTQNSLVNGWYPNVAGVVQLNYGEILNCYNFAPLTIVSLNEAQTVVGEAYLGGICAMNYNKIYKSLNKGNLVVTSKKIIVYCGGICANSSRFVSNEKIINSLIDGCGVDCQIDVKTEYETAYTFVGGLCGYMYGTINKSYSLASFAEGYDKTKYFVGLCVGYTSAEISDKIYVIISAEQDYVLAQENVTLQIGALVYINQIIQGVNVSGDKIFTINSIDELKQVEVYWDE